MSDLTPQLNARVAQDLISGIRSAGVTHAVVSPGSRNTPVLMALAAAGVEIHVVLDERAAGFVALGLSRALRAPVALSCTSGSAGANYLPAIVEAFHGRTPLVVITSDRPEELQGRGAPQTMRQTGLYGHFVGGSIHLDAPRTEADCASVAEQAFQLVSEAQSERSPVHVNVAFREPLWAPTDWSAKSSTRQIPPKAPQPDTFDAVRDVFDCRSGVFICGPDTARDPAERAIILDVARRLGWPVIAEASSGVRFGTPHPNLMTTYDALMRSAASRTLKPDCVIRFGRTNTSRPLNEWLQTVAAGRLVVVDSSPFPSDPDRLSHTHLRLSAVDFCARMGIALAESPVDSEWLGRWQTIEATLAAFFEEEVNTSWWEGSIARTVLDLAPEQAIIHLANSMPIRDVDNFCPPGGRSLNVYCNRGVNGIDGTLATIAGEALGHPSRPVVALVGDLAFLHDAGSLALLRDARATIVVVDNGGGGIFEFLPIASQTEHFDSLFITPQETVPESVAAGYGARAVRVSSLEALRRALTADVEREGLGVIVAEVSRPHNVARHQAVWSQAGRLLEGC